MEKILGDCEALARVTGDDASSARRRLEHALGSELASRLVGALGARHGRTPLL